MRRSGGRKIAHVHLAGFTSGAHGEVGDAVRKLLKQGADGVVLDLRDNGGGLLNEAVMVSSVFIPDGKIVTTRGRSRPEQVYEATGGAIDERHPRGRARQRPQRLRVRDRDRRAAGPRPGEGGRHAHVRQGRLPGDRAAAPTAARSTSRSASTSCPAAATSAAAGSSAAPACPRTCRPRTTRRRRATRRWSPRCARRREAPGRARAPPSAQRPSSACWPSAAASGPSSRSSTAAGASTSTARATPAPGDLVLRGLARQGRARPRPARRGARRARGADAPPRPAAALRPARRARGARGR